MNLHTLLFDLDGTLTDSQEGITRCVAYALETVCGIRVADRSTLTAYIGPPLVDGFMANHGLDRETAVRCTAAYRERYRDTGLFENAVYPGIPEALTALRDTGYELAVATSKPEVFTDRILAHFDLTDYFTVVSGASMDGTVSTKAQVVAQTLRRLGDPAPETVLMIGDRSHDVLGAAACGVRTLGVLYGFGSRAELTEAGAWAVCPTPADLPDAVAALDRP